MSTTGPSTAGNPEYEHWSQSWEANVTQVLYNEDAIQGEISDSLRRGDFFQASTAAFEHVLTSYELGDYLEAHSYMLIGQMLAHAGVALAAEGLPEEQVSFRLPDCVTRDPRHNTALYPHNPYSAPEALEKDEDYEPTELELTRAIADTVMDVEATLMAGPEISSTTKNVAIRNAIRTTCSLLFSNYPIDQGSVSDRSELLTLAKQLAQHLDVNVDKESTLVAFTAFELLAAGGLYVEGKAFSALNTAARGFEEIKKGGVVDDKLIEAICSNHINNIYTAKAQRLAFQSLAPVLNLYACFKPHLDGSNDFGKWHKARTSRVLQRQARYFNSRHANYHELIMAGSLGATDRLVADAS